MKESHVKEDNLNPYAHMFNISSEQNDDCDKVNKEKDKEINQTEKKDLAKTKKFKTIVAIVISVLAVVVVAGTIISGMIGSLGSQSYDDVVEYLARFNEPDVIVEKTYAQDWDIEKTSECEGENCTLAIHIGYDKTTSTTFMREEYTDGRSGSVYSVVRVLEKDIAHLPEITAIYGYVSFAGEYNPMHFNDKFVRGVDGESADDYILRVYVDEEDNYITKIPSLIIGDTEVNLYWIQNYPIDGSHYILGVVEVGDGVLHISSISVHESSPVETILESIEKYFYIVSED